MKYMLLIYMGEEVLSEEERQHCYIESTELAHQLKADGQFVATAPLQSIATATSVRVREGKRMVTDGPFADLDEAIEIASRIPGARVGTVEIRPVVENCGHPQALRGLDPVGHLLLP